ncbi:hypothetical protein BpHYR1_042053 [Brachionus plicatilis]|uniref:Uncharacterized protein n=1 Tax=Brachionus plicatilis TaxID=10195 RepID=A0A3M7P2B7_BRAPC|nr:hypothetical protein BpHYR1_042053 [Brachionus plicatilis]
MESFYHNWSKNKKSRRSFNLKINRYIDYNHPHNGGISQCPKRLKDIQRDEMLSYLKTKLNDQKISSLANLKRVIALFRYVKSLFQVRLQTQSSLPEQVKTQVQALSIFKISNQSFSFIKAYINEHRFGLILLTKNLRKFSNTS